jgi:hypothetical protein
VAVGTGDEPDQTKVRDRTDCRLAMREAVGDLNPMRRGEWRTFVGGIVLHPALRASAQSGRSAPVPLDRSSSLPKLPGATDLPFFTRCRVTVADRTSPCDLR